VSASLLVACHACKQYKDDTELYMSIRNLDELVPPVYDRERWWYKLTQASRPPFPLLKETTVIRRVFVYMNWPTMHIDVLCCTRVWDPVAIYDNLMRDCKSREHTFSVGTQARNSLTASFKGLKEIAERRLFCWTD